MNMVSSELGTTRVTGTDQTAVVEVVRNGDVVRTVHPGRRRARLSFVDGESHGSAYYYVRVTQVNADEHGNLLRAWSSPIWVRRSTPDDR
jgi:hypothetical protein